MLYDAHNHLQDAWLRPHLPQIERDLAALPLGAAVVNGTHPDDWPHVAALAQRLPWVRPSYGLHPWECGRRPADWREQLAARLEADPRAHVGEIGLDRWILDEARADDPRLLNLPRAPLDEQIEAFRWQFTWAAEHNRVATVHCLQAWGPLLEHLQQLPRAPRGFLLHAYSGPAEMLPQWIALGATFSFSPAFLDLRKTRQREAFRAMPADRLLVETDAPALPPPSELADYRLPDEPTTRQRLSHPANIAVAYRGLAALRGVSDAELRAGVAANFLRLFDAR